MVNYLGLEAHPDIRHEVYFEVIKDFRKGGLNPDNFDNFLNLIQQLPPVALRTPNDYLCFTKLNLSDISEKDKEVIQKEIRRRSIESAKKCWHPLSSNQTCKLDSSGNILISRAHSIQNNGILKKIASDDLVMCYKYTKSEFEGTEIKKEIASIFWGFCNTHDSIFSPIETKPYKMADEQNFLFAYRGFVVASHKKQETAYSINYGTQADNDIKENKKIFDDAILNQKYDVIETEVFELSAFYPIAASSSFYLDYDFEGNTILHAEDRMEDIFITFFPSSNTSFFLLSYFKKDKHLYGLLGEQLRKRNNLRSDITMLIAGHAENVYFSPTYYETFIEKHEKNLAKLLFHTQFDHATIKPDNSVDINFSFTPSNYLNNPYEINFFGY